MAIYGMIWGYGYHPQAVLPFANSKVSLFPWGGWSRIPYVEPPINYCNGYAEEILNSKVQFYGFKSFLQGK